MIVVIVIGFLMMMAIPTFSRVRDQSRISAFLNDFRQIKEAINRFNLEEGRYPIAEGGGGPDPLFAEYMDMSQLMSTTPIGGSWTVNVDSYTFALGTVDHEVSDEVLTRIDESLDDGSLGSGRMLVAGNEFLFIIED